VEEEIARIVDSLLDSSEKPQAIFASRDFIAFVVIKALKARGVRVPEDIAVVGFSECPELSRIFVPSLTCMLVPVAEMGRIAAEKLAGMIGGTEDNEILREVIPCRIIQGGSTAKA
jgi:DNA-binding LacI/PurR family transcriptional regulator